MSILDSTMILNLKKLYNEHKRTIVPILVLFFILIVAGMFYSSGKEDISPGQQTRLGICEDSDGSNIYKKGAVLYTDTKGRHTEEDYCSIGEKQLYEMACRKNSFLGSDATFEKKSFDCKNGCINGACLK